MADRQNAPGGAHDSGPTTWSWGVVPPGARVATLERVITLPRMEDKERDRRKMAEEFVELVDAYVREHYGADKFMLEQVEFYRRAVRAPVQKWAARAFEKLVGQCRGKKTEALLKPYIEAARDWNIEVAGRSRIYAPGLGPHGPGTW